MRYFVTLYGEKCTQKQDWINRGVQMGGTGSRDRKLRQEVGEDRAGAILS